MALKASEYANELIFDNLFSNCDKTRYKEFEINGKFNPMGLENLKKLGIERILPVSIEERTEPKEIRDYSTPLTKITIFANYETNHHTVLVYLKEDSENKVSIMENTKKMLEKKLRCKLNDKIMVN
jgi:hypothetical protein